MAPDIGEVFAILQETGFYDYLLPFLLVFSIIFAILEKTKIFGIDKEEKPRTNINVVLSFVIALIVIVQTEIVNIINIYLSKMALVMIVILIFMLVIGMLGGDVDKAKGIPMFGVIIAVVAVIWALTPNIGGMPAWLHLSDMAIAWLIVLGIFIVIIWVVTAGGRDNSNRGSGRLYFEPKS